MRNKVIKKILIAVLALTLALVATATFAYSRYIPMGRVMPGIYAIRNYNNNFPFVNFFLFQAGEKYIAIDTGLDIAQTEDALRRLGISANDIVAVFITHDDEDHIGALGLFANAAIYTGPVKLSDFSHEVLPDGEIIELYGVSIKIIYTPGHTSGCVAYLIDGRYLFVGDLFVNPAFARYNTELQIMYRDMVLEMDGVEYIFTAHFGLFRDIRLFRWWF